MVARCLPYRPGVVVDRLQAGDLSFAATSRSVRTVPRVPAQATVELTPSTVRTRGGDRLGPAAGVYDRCSQACLRGCHKPDVGNETMT